MRSATGDSKTPYNYAHTQAHPKQLQATVTLRQKKRQTDRSRNRRTHEVPFIVACSHFTRKNTRFRAPAFSPKHSPCNIMQPLQCGSQHQLANLHLSTHRTRPEQQMTRVMQPFQCDLQQIPKHPITPHTQAHPKQLQATVTLRQKKKRQTDRSRNRRTHEVPFIVACSHFTRKNTRFRAPASSPKHSPCNIMQPLQCGSQHQLANLHLSTHRTTPEQQMTRVMQPFQCDLQPEIPKHPITTHTHTSTPKAASSHRYTAAKKKTNRPQPQPSHTWGTFHRRLQPLYTEKHKVSCSGFLPNSPLAFVTASLPHHFPSSPPRFVTTSLPHHFPSSPRPIVTTSLRPLPFLTTSLPHHSPSSSLPFVTTSLRPLPFLTTSLPHHSPSSPLPFIITSLRHHFPSSPPPFLTTSLRHHFSSSPPVIITTLHQGQFHRFLFLCYVLLCFVLLCNLPPFIISSLRILFVRNTEVLLPNFLWLFEVGTQLLSTGGCTIPPTSKL